MNIGEDNLEDVSDSRWDQVVDKPVVFTSYKHRQKELILLFSFDDMDLKQELMRGIHANG